MVSGWFTSGDGVSILGIIIPSVVFIISFGITWLLYRHFSAK